MTTNRVTLNAATIVRVLATVAGLLVLIGIAGQLTKHLTEPFSGRGLITLFDMDRESNIPTFFSASLLLFAAFLLGAIAMLKRKSRDPFGWWWTALSIAFLYMAVDEGASIHEFVLGRLTRSLLGEPTIGMFYFAWVIPGIAITLVFAIVFFRFFLHLPRSTKWGVLVAATLFVGGAMGVELVEGHYASLYGVENLTFSMMAAVEESMEMAGVIVFIDALLKLIEDHYGEVGFRFGPAESSATRED